MNIASILKLAAEEKKMKIKNLPEIYKRFVVATIDNLSYCYYGSFDELYKAKEIMRRIGYNAAIIDMREEVF